MFANLSFVIGVVVLTSAITLAKLDSEECHLIPPYSDQVALYQIAGSIKKKLSKKLMSVNRYDSYTICDLKRALVGFIRLLQSFIIEYQFSAAKFEKVESKLERQLAAIRLVADYPEFFNEKVETMFRFASHMFKVMRFTTEELKKLNFGGSTDEYLLINMLELNVGILGLCDYEGNLDNLIFGNSGKVIRYWKLLNTWGADFDSFNNAPIAIERLFQDQRAKALQALKFLWVQTPV